MFSGLTKRSGPELKLKLSSGPTLKQGPSQSMTTISQCRFCLEHIGTGRQVSASSTSRKCSPVPPIGRLQRWRNSFDCSLRTVCQNSKMDSKTNLDFRICRECARPCNWAGQACISPCSVCEIARESTRIPHCVTRHRWRETTKRTRTARSSSCTL